MNRQNAEKYPGVMLERPSFLINPWRLPENTTTNDQEVETGDNFSNRNGGEKRRALGRFGGARASDGLSTQPQLDPSRNFGEQTPLVITNLSVDEQGSLILTDPRLTMANQIRVVALKDSQTIQHTLTKGI